jgi:hypothetical protein
MDVTINDRRIAQYSIRDADVVSLRSLRSQRRR